MTLAILSPAAARTMIDQGAELIDIREADEHARESIPGARNAPLSKLEAALPAGHRPIVYHCRSGNRTIVNTVRLEAAAKGRKAVIMEGGIEAWRDAGLPTRKDVHRPIELMRQVQIAAGALAAAGAALGLLLHPGFHALPLLVGGGLMFAGTTGTCGMARMLARAPWNRGLAAPSAA
jgi:rhodanese-related sulfurtransferase